MGIGMGLPLIGGSIITDAILLVALALGYIVCYFANQEEKNLKLGGVIIGLFIIVLSLVLLISSFIIKVKMVVDFNNMMPDKQMMMHKGMQHSGTDMPMPPPPPSPKMR